MPRSLKPSWSRVALFAEAAAALGIATAAVRCLPFRVLARRLGRMASESAPDEPSARLADLTEIRWALNAAAHRFPWACSCLVQAVAGKAMLRRRGIGST